MALCLSTKMPIKIPSKQKSRTWKFAGEYLLRKQFQTNQVDFGKWTRDQIIELGPTFVKIGQIASSRVDLYPLEFTQQLESLQDNVPPIAKDVVRLMVRPHLNNNVFAFFDYEPFKSASIGQVHRAKLSTGEEVIVKLKRPNIYNIMKNDTDNIKQIVEFLEKIGIDTGTNTGYVLDESIDFLLAESDYEKEIENAKKFRKRMKKVKWVKVPKIYTDISS